MSEILNREYQSMAANAICHAAEMLRLDLGVIAYEHTRPCVLFRPLLSNDGNMWCVLYGPNLAEGVAGFGVSPEKAMLDFDTQWTKAA